MKTLREAAEIALMALDHPNFQGAEEAEIILRSVLEQHAQQEKTYASLERYTQEIRTILAGSAKSKPLTDEEILKMWDDTRNDPIAPSVFCLIACVRHVERAHGIGGKE